MSINNGDKPAQPSKISINRESGEIITYQFGNNDFEESGLTKREHFAAMAMQGLCVNTGRNGYNNEEELAKMSVLIADGLLKELER